MSAHASAPLHWTRDGGDWPHRTASRFVRAGGLRWHLQQFGPASAPLLLLLHGTGASTHSWRDLVPRLLPHFQVLSLDLPGHAFTQGLPRGRSTLPDMSRALEALLESEQLAPRVAVGHSAGAALMLHMALDGRLTDCRLIGLNAALLPFGGWGHFLYASVARVMAGSGVVPQLAAWRARDLAVVRRLVASTGSRLDEVGVGWYARLLRSPGHVAHVLAMMANWDLEPLQREFPRVKGLHLVVGERDTTVPPSQALQVAARTSGTTVHRLTGLGHLAHEEAPQRVAEMICSIAADVSKSAQDER
jgi:magnesium chelatase accessory protein